MLIDPSEIQLLNSEPGAKGWCLLWGIPIKLAKIWNAQLTLWAQDKLLIGLMFLNSSTHFVVLRKALGNSGKAKDWNKKL